MLTTDRPKMRATPGPRLSRLPQLEQLDPEIRHEIDVVSAILPFKVNNYVLEELIDWDRVPDDPIYRLTFPHRDMLSPELYDAVDNLLRTDLPRSQRTTEIAKLRMQLNPHPGDQLQANVPQLDDEPVSGLQHKYRETVLVFPGQGQTCHSYCGYCFRWAQFIGIADLKQATPNPDPALQYLREHREVSDVLFTGGDPMIMSTERLTEYLEPLLNWPYDHVRNIRLGTKALGYWPYRFTTDTDADDLLRFIERLTNAGKQVAVMTHFSHPRELDTDAARTAIRRLRDAGAILRAQAPIVRHVNDDADTWATMWRTMTHLGVSPYYMFVERDTGASNYFELPLAKAYGVYREALASVSGLERTARGPVMSASPGKVIIDGIADIAGERVFCCRFLQARNPDWVGRPFFARYDDTAMWFDDLRPALGQRWFWDPAADSSSAPEQSGCPI